MVTLRLRHFLWHWLRLAGSHFLRAHCRYFSGKGFGSILGYSTVAVGVGGALGSWLGGAFYDWTGSYLISFALSTVVLSISDVCIWLAAVPSVANYDKRLWAAESTRANLRDAQ